MMKHFCAVPGQHWSTLQSRRQIARLMMFLKAIYINEAIQIPSYFSPPQRVTRGYHHLHYNPPFISTTAYQQSLFPRTVKEWNNLPTTIIEISRQSLFRDHVLRHFM